MKERKTIMIDNHIYETYAACPRKFELHILNDWRLTNDRSSIIMGAALHRALEEWYLTGDMDRCFAHIEDEYADQTIDDYRTKERAKAAMLAYVANYPNEHFSIIESGGKKWLEVSFSIPLTTIETADNVYDIVYAGNFDAIIKWNDMIFVLDHKTTSSLGPTFFDRFKPNNQLEGYCFAARELTGMPVEGAVVNAICIKTTSFEFDRRVISFRDDDLSEWKDDMIETSKEMIQMIERGYFPRRTTSCMQYGYCSFHQVCSSPKVTRMNVLETHYTQKKWNPLNRRGEENA